MKEISTVLKEMRASLVETKKSFDHREFVTYMGKYKRSYADGLGKADDAGARYATVKFNIVMDRILRSYEIRLREVAEGLGKKSSRKMHVEIKNLSDCLTDYVKSDMPEWYELAEKSGKIKDIRAKTQELMERI